MTTRLYWHPFYCCSLAALGLGCCAPCAGITPRASTTAWGPVRAARASSRELSRRTPSTSVWRTRTAPWTSGGGTGASSAGSRSVSLSGWSRRLSAQTLSRAGEVVFPQSPGGALVTRGLGGRCSQWRSSHPWCGPTWSRHQNWRTWTIPRWLRERYYW